MRRTTLALLLILLVTFGDVAFADEMELPWRQAGLTEAEAAGHLLDRLAFGARPGDVERVVDMGLDKWVAYQLNAGFSEPQVNDYLQDLPSLQLPTQKIAEVYPDPALLKRMAVQAGVVSEDFRGRPEDGERRDPGERRKLREWSQSQGYRPMFELLGDHMKQKVYRAVYAENQLQEVMTDFWFNHFNVSITKPQCRVYVPTYERDAIRPHVLGSFPEMLTATAKHPAMLLYLDNARSVAEDGQPVTFDRNARRNERLGQRRGGPAQNRRANGLNENYARELLELHTLGVDSGYTQEDVIEVARAFTGWATYPPRGALGGMAGRMEERLQRARRFPNSGFVLEDDFLFRADAHDAGKKTVLGQTLPAGRGIQDGYDVLNLVAHHPSTARHLAHKLAVRFVADQPPAALVDRLEETFKRSRGDLQQVMRDLVASPEFWSDEARRAKIKSPFELAVSSLRALDAEVTDPAGIVDWVGRMGQPLYAYEAPTGYDDNAEAWVNTGSLLSRMNFGLELATGRIGGVRIDLPALNDNREPESLAAALQAYVPLLMPQRDPLPTIQQLTPMLNSSDLQERIAEAEGQSGTSFAERWRQRRESMTREGLRDRDGMRGLRSPPPGKIDNSPLAHVVGLVISSPEFQRR